MLSVLHIGLNLVLLLLPVAVGAQPTCVAAELSDQRVKDIVEEQRAQRSDLPRKFSDYRWRVEKDGCHYVYVEFPQPEVPDASQAIVLNQHGVIIDARAGVHDQSFECSDNVLSDDELTSIVEEERTKRSDLPRPFANNEIRVRRLRCLYLYVEYNLPRRRGDYQVFRIDPYGELMSFSRSEPY